MPNRSQCLDDEAVRRFVLGQLPDSETDAVNEHVLACGHCAAALNARTDQDELIATMNAQVMVPQEDAEREVVECLIDRLCESGLRGGGLSHDLGAAELPGKLLGEYRIIREVGRGGMGVVYEAEQASLGRRVALKVLPVPAFLDAEYRKRFEREAKAAARLHHTNIVPVFGVGEQDGLHYYAMQFIQGQGLDEVLVELRRVRTEKGRGTRMKEESGRHYWQSVARIGVQVADAMTYAASQGVLHRDIKPSNLLLDAHGTAWVTDFGLAKAADSDELTHTGDIVGTLRYMAPERFHGQSDIRSDVYGLGLTLYELLTLQPGFQESDRHKLMHQILQNDPIPPHRLDPAIPRDLETIVLKATAREPVRRFQTAAEMADDLRRFLDDQPIRARAISRIARAWRWCRRNPAVASLAATVAALLLVAIVGLAISNVLISQKDREKTRALVAAQASEAESKVQEGRALEQAHLAEENRRMAVEEGERADRERGRAKDEERVARWHLYAAQMDLAEEAWQRGEAGRMLELLETQRSSLDGEDLRGFEWYYLWRLCHQGHRRTLHGHRAGVHFVAYSPDGRTLVSASGDGAVNRWETATGIEQASFPRLGIPGAPVTLTPDGSLIAIGGGDGTIKLLDLTTGEERGVFEGHRSYISELAFSPDGKTLASGSGDTTVRLWDVSTGREVRTFTGHSHWISGLVFAPDGKSIASVAYMDEPVFWWDVETGQVRKQFAGHRWSLQCLAFSHDGSLLATGGDDRRLRVYDAESGNLLHTLHGHSLTILSIAFSPDGTTVASGSQDGTVNLWDIATGQKRTYAHFGPVRLVAFAPDGLSLATASDDRTIRLWDSQAQRTGLFQESGPVVWRVTFSSDSATVAVAGDSPTITLWNAATGELCGELDGVEGPVYALGFSPDSHTLASGGNTDGSIVLWNVATRKQRAILKAHRKGVRGVTFSPDGMTLASCGTDSQVILWDPDTEQPRVLGEHGGWVHCIEFSPDGQWLASGGGDKTVRIWDVASGKEQATLQGHVGQVLSLAFSRDGQTLISMDDAGGVKVWDTLNWSEFPGLPDRAPSAQGRGRGLALAPDGRTLAVSSGGDVRLWDLHSHRERATLTGHGDWVATIAFAPDGHSLVTGAWDGSVKLWFTATEDDVLAQSSMDLALRRFTLLLNRGAESELAGRYEQAITDYEKAIAAKPDEVAATNSLAWLLATCPSPETRDPNRAVELASSVVQLAPNDGYAWNTLGVAKYRLGHFREAIEALETSLKFQGVNGWDLYFLAMCHHQLGDSEKAVEYYNQAIQWREAQTRLPTNQSDELARFRAEAESLLK